MSAKKAILIVDDEAILLLSIRMELRHRFGAEFLYETALSAEEGLAAIDVLADSGVEVELVISDWLMPGMRGDEFLTRVHQIRPSVKLILLSGHAEAPQMKDLAERIGLFAFLSKPYRSMTFFDAVGRAMGVT